jgi:hypothetical protein
MTLTPHFWSTALGSYPDTDSLALSRRLPGLLDLPAWPQLPRRSFRENMYIQYSPALPGLVLDEAREKIYFDTQRDLSPEFEAFYERYLEDDLDYFGLRLEYAAGFFDFLESLGRLPATASDPGDPGAWVKGQVTGPVSFGLTVTDQGLRASLYDDALCEAIVKGLAMNARWQARRLKSARPNVLLFVDEPYMASFGSAFISLDRQQVLGMLNELFAAIHQESALAGVHCCGNTDWSVLMESSVDVLNLDAWSYLDTLALYPVELRAFLDRGGLLAWGIVPNNEHIFETSPADLAARLHTGIKNICRKAAGRGVEIQAQEFERCSLLAPCCGLGPASPEVAERSLLLLGQLAHRLQEGG